MTFPYYFNIFGLNLHPHVVFEYLSIFVGFQIYMRTRKKHELSNDRAGSLFLVTMFGGYFGGIILASLEHYDKIISSYHAGNLMLIQGKTIVGALLGGLIAVELYKKKIGYTKSTGDDIAIPLAIGLIIGRVGCFLTGVEDSTVGIHTDFFLGVDFGDGLRHPTQLYEIAFLIILIFILHKVKKANIWDGFVFQLFMLSYLTFRFFIDFIKPIKPILFGLSAIQIACVLGVMYYILLIRKKYKAHIS